MNPHKPHVSTTPQQAAEMEIRQSVPLFVLGAIVATPAVLTHLERHGIAAASLLQRHVTGDWGEVDQDDAKENDISVQQGFRILSCYTVADERIWVITEADRSSTTLLFPSEY